MYLILYRGAFYDEIVVYAPKSFSVTCVIFKHYDSIVIGLSIHSFLPGWGIQYTINFNAILHKIEHM